jgi:hypothetical protein
MDVFFSRALAKSYHPSVIEEIEELRKEIESFMMVLFSIKAYPSSDIETKNPEMYRFKFVTGWFWWLNILMFMYGDKWKKAIYVVSNA